MCTGWVNVLAFVVVLGVPDGALGVLWPALRDAFHRPLSDLGVLFFVATALYLLGGLTFARLTRRASVEVLVIASCASSAVCCFAWAAAGTWAVVLVGIGGFGFGRGLLDAAGNAGVSGDIRRLGWLHAAWSVGGATGPLLVAGLASLATWRLPVVLIALMSAAIAAVGVAVGSSTSDARRPSRSSPHAHVGARTSTAILLATFATYTAAEAGPTAWAYVFLTESRHVPGLHAAIIVAAFWAALTLGRVALGVVGDRVAAGRTLAGSCLAFTVAMTLLWLGPTGLAWAALPASGAATAAIFPVLVNVTPQLVGAHATHRTIGFAIAAAAVGGPTAVYLEGITADHLGVASFGPALALATLPLAATTALLLTRLPGPEFHRTSNAAGRANASRSSGS